MTTTRLESYLAGSWVAGTGSGRPLVNPTNEEVLAEADTQGLDMAGAVNFARTQGLPALQALTFAERAALVGKVSKALHAHRDELLELSTVSGGNTRGDAKFDVDGATGTLMYYAKQGEALGATKLLLDGEPDQLARSPRYVGRHIRVPRAGVAVHINAYNFPAWGAFEKAAVSWLAGLPVISKPATSTALLFHRMAKIVADADVLPAGAFQCVIGSLGDLMDHLSGQDCVAFTGSSGTAATLRSHACVVERGTRLGVEADSLNAAVLGRDVESGTDTFDLFVREVARDMTQKAGQKCTAIRRVFVPKERLAEVEEALVEELARIRVGDPALKEVRCGPVATKSQLADVQEGLARLDAALHKVCGGERGELVGVDGDKGYFVQPTLFRADAAMVDVVNAHEVFGPCATLLPYSGEPGEAACAVAAGQGGLVASVYTDDAEVAAGVTLGIAPFNGRINIGSAKVAEHSMGPGTVLPNLVHGGPGRAGGGEELGGLRGLDFYTQRVAVQGYKPLLEKIVQ